MLQLDRVPGARARRNVSQQWPPTVQVTLEAQRNGLSWFTSYIAPCMRSNRNFYRTQWSAKSSVFGTVCDFFVCVSRDRKGVFGGYLGNNRWRDLRQIHREDVFGPSLGWIWVWSKVKGQRLRSPRTKHFRPFRQHACGLCLVKHI